MPLGWDIAKLEGTSSNTGGAVWATPPEQQSDIAKRGVLIALCDSQGAAYASSNASLTAVSVLDKYYYRPPRDDDSPEVVLTEGIGQAQFMVRYYPANTQTAAAGRAAGENVQDPLAASGNSLTLIAAVAHRGNLYVAHTGRNRAYLWRNGELKLLTDGLPPSSEIWHASYQFASQDRVLLCTEGFYQNVSETQIAQILKAEPDPTRATAALLNAAARTQPARTASVAVLDYTRGLFGVVPPVAIGAAIVAVIALGVLALFISGQLSSQAQDSANVAILASPTSSPSAAPPSSTAAPLQTPSSTPVTQQVPAVATGVATASATATPQPISTATPTLEPSPTGTPVASATATVTATVAFTVSPTATAALTRRPTPTPAPTPRASPPATRLPRTPTPAPATVQAPAYAQPQLLAPKSGSAFVVVSAPIFSWTAAGQLASDDYYVLAIQHVNGVDEQWVKETTAVAPVYLPLLKGSAAFKWNVSVRRKTGNTANGANAGPVLVQSAETWEFTWVPGESSNPAPAAPTVAPQPPPPTSPPQPTSPPPQPTQPPLPGGTVVP